MRNRIRQLMLCAIISLLFSAHVIADHITAGGEIKSPVSIPGTVKINAEGVINLVESIPNIIIVDSRIENDRTQGYIEGSVSLPDEETNCQSLANIIPNKNHPTLYYCNGPKCGRSATAAKIAIKCDYTNIYWFRGGFEEWNHKGYPIIK